MHFNRPKGLKKRLHSHLQYQRDAGGEEGHKHKVVGQDRHAAKAAHDFQLTHTWKMGGGESDSLVNKIKQRED